MVIRFCKNVGFDYLSQNIFPIENDSRSRKKRNDMKHQDYHRFINRSVIHFVIEKQLPVANIMRK